MAKLMRENRLRERRSDKKAKKDARKLAPVDQPAWDAEPVPDAEQSAAAPVGEPVLQTAASAATDA